MIYYIIIAFIILVILWNFQIIEGYDARYTNTSFTDCAIFSKTTAGCNGFGYDTKNQICYPSKTIIDGKPLYSIFKDEYTEDNAFCNKIQPIEDPNPNPGFVDRRKNSVFICTETKGQHPQYYFENKNAFNNIGEEKNIDDIFDVESYAVKPYNWPVNNFDQNQTDIYQKKKANEVVTPENTTNVNRIINYTPPEIIEKHKVIQPETPVRNQLDFKLENIRNNITNAIKKMAPNLLIPTSKYNVNPSKTKQTKRDKYITFQENNNMNSGQYLMDYKCTKNIPVKDCLDYCSSQVKCLGVEWNPNFNDSSNVCCPYKTIGEYVKRPENKMSGKFYEKHSATQLNKDQNYVYD